MLPETSATPTPSPRFPPAPAAEKETQPTNNDCSDKGILFLEPLLPTATPPNVLKEDSGISTFSSSLADPAEEDPIYCWQSNHDSHLMAIPDIDEAIHGITAIATQASTALSGKEARIDLLQGFTDEISVMKENPGQLLPREMIPDNPVEFGVTIGTDALLFGLSAVAIVSGVHCAVHAGKEGRALSSEKKRLSQNSAQLQSEKELIPVLRAAELKLIEQALTQTQLAQKINQLHGATGVVTATSAAAILAKTLVDCTQIHFFIHPASAVSAAGVTFATVAGASVFLVLWPVSALCTVALGALFIKRTSARQKAFLTSSDAATQCLLKTEETISKLPKNNSLPDLDTKNFKKYQDFIFKKLKDRKAFYQWFKRFNIAFFCAALFYVACAAVKYVAVILALAGLGAVISSPVGWAVLALLIAFGALAMAIASFQFFLGHPKCERLEAFTRGDTPYLDRKFLLRQASVAAQRKDSWTATCFRANLHDSLKKRALALRTFKTTAGEHLRQKIKRKALRGSLTDIWAGLQALASATSVLCKARGIKETLRTCKRVFAEKRAYLSAANLNIWINESDEGKQALLDFKMAYLHAEISYQELKVKNRSEIYAMLENTEPTPQSATAELKSEVEKAKLVDEKRYKLAEKCLATQDLKESNRLFLEIMGIPEEEATQMDEKAVYKKLTQILADTLDKRIKITKEMLVDTEMEASQLQKITEDEIAKAVRSSTKAHSDEQTALKGETTLEGRGTPIEESPPQGLLERALSFTPEATLDQTNELPELEGDVSVV